MVFRALSRYRSLRLGLPVAGLALLSVLALSVFPQRAAALYSDSYIDSHLPAGIATAHNYDDTCRSALGSSDTFSGSDALRTDINNGGSYWYKVWISQDGSPNITNPISVPYGTKHIALQINGVDFLCRTMIQPDLTSGCSIKSVSGKDILNAGGWVNSDTDAKDAKPNPAGGDCMFPALTNVSTQYRNIQVAGGADGTVGLPAIMPQLVNTPRDETTRYWFANRTVNFTYDAKAAAGFTTTETVLFTVTYRQINSYSSVNQCQPPSGGGVSSSGSFGSCDNLTAQYAVQIVVGPPPDATPTGSISATCSMSYPDNTPTYHFTFSYHDSDGTSGNPVHALITNGKTATKHFSGVGGDSSYVESPSPYTGQSNVKWAYTGSWNDLSGNGAPSGNAWLRVQDVSPGGGHSFDDGIAVSVGRPTCPPADSVPTGSVSATCTINASGDTIYRFTFTYHDSDGTKGTPVQALITNGSASEKHFTGVGGASSFVTSPSPYTGQNGATWSYKGDWNDLSGNGAPSGNAWLRVQDVYPDGGHSFPDGIAVSVGMPNCAPDVEATLTCNADGTGKVAITATDPKGTVSVYGASADGSSPTGKHDAPWTWASVTSMDTAWSTWTVTVYSNDPGSGSSAYALRITKSHAPCASVNCNSNLQSGFGGIIPGGTVTFTVTAKIVGSKTPPPGANFDIAITGPVNQSYNNVNGTPASNSATTWVVTSAPQTFTTNQAGTYTLTWTYYGKNCGGKTADAGYAPFFSVLGGDTSAGLGFGSACTDDTDALIKGWNNDGTPASDYSGAGTDRGAIALGDITTFATAQSNFNGTTSISPPSQLAFANTTGGGNRYGGGFGLTSSCLPDYQDQALNTPGAVAEPSSPPTQTVDLSTMDSGTYVFKNAITSLHGTVGAGKHITIVVDHHNAFIDGNITYAPYNNIDDIPQFELLVKGSVYIKSTVTELHGFYDAQEANGGAGNMYTCASAFNSLAGTTYDTCNSQLTFYGAVSATNIYLERSYGNLHAVGSIPADAAEKVVFTPELWLTGAQGSPDGSGIGAWQAVTSLPPVL